MITVVASGNYKCKAPVSIRRDNTPLIIIICILIEKYKDMQTNTNIKRVAYLQAVSVC